MGSEKAAVKVLRSDDVMAPLMELWQRLDEEKMDKHMEDLDNFFAELDADGNGTIEFSEFQAVLETPGHAAMGLEQLVSLFDEGLTLSSEETGQAPRVTACDSM